MWMTGARRSGSVGELCFDRREQRRKRVAYRLPDNFGAHALVVVTIDIARAGNAEPRQIGVSLTISTPTNREASEMISRHRVTA